MAAHLLREWLYGHYRGRAPLLVADRRAADACSCSPARSAASGCTGTSSASTRPSPPPNGSTALPLLAAPLARNFLADSAVSDRLFSLFVFVHLGVPLLLLFALWFHIQRLTRAAVWPARPVSTAFVLMLVALAIAAPVSSHAPADLATVPQALRLDWVLLFIHPLAEAATPAVTWALAGACLAALFALPFLPQASRVPVAVVDPANCNGCRRCFADCPFAAVTMVPHPNQKCGTRDGAGGRRPVHRLRHLCRRLPVVDAVSQRHRTRHRHRPAAGADQCPARTPAPGPGRACPASNRSSSSAATMGPPWQPLAGPDVAAFSLVCSGAAAALLRRVRAARRCRRRAGQRLSRRSAASSGSVSAGPRSDWRVSANRTCVPPCRRERIAMVWADAGEQHALQEALQRLRSRVHRSARHRFDPDRMPRMPDSHAPPRPAGHAPGSDRSCCTRCSLWSSACSRTGRCTSTWPPTRR